MARLPEQRAWDTMRDTINPWNLLTHRVENMCVDGMSDVVAINRRGTVFWLENKALADWPAKAGTFPLRDAFEPGQIPFMRQWKHWGGHAFVLLRVDKEYFLLDPNKELATSTKIELANNVIAMTKKGIIDYLEDL